MPSPIAHAATGYCLGQLWYELRAEKKSLLRRAAIGLAIVGAIVADVDFVPQLLTNLSFHRGITHSMGVGILFSVVMSYFFSKRSFQRFLSLSLLGFLAYSSHLFLDVLTAGGSGIPAFWPITNASIQFPISLFPQVHHSEGLFYSGHLFVLLFETTYSAFLIGITHGVIRFYGSARESRNSKASSNALKNQEVFQKNSD